MKALYLVLAVCAAAALVGCETISKPYIMTVDRVDQQVEGNKGYLQGTPPSSQEKANPTRQLIAVDMDLVTIQGKATKPTTIVYNNQSSAAAPVEENTK
jgi:uncharacterized protein YsxB (DUF464 family)